MTCQLGGGGRSSYLLGPRFGFTFSPTHWEVGEGRCETGTRERGRPNGTALRDREQGPAGSAQACQRVANIVSEAQASPRTFYLLNHCVCQVFLNECFTGK